MAKSPKVVMPVAEVLVDAAEPRVVVLHEPDVRLRTTKFAVFPQDGTSPATKLKVAAYEVMPERPEELKV